MGKRWGKHYKHPTLLPEKVSRLWWRVEHTGLKLEQENWEPGEIKFENSQDSVPERKDKVREEAHVNTKVGEDEQDLDICRGTPGVFSWVSVKAVIGEMNHLKGLEAKLSITHPLNTHKYLNEIRKLIQDMNEKFSKAIEVLAINQNRNLGIEELNKSNKNSSWKPQH